MNQETLLRANAELYGTLTIIGGVLDGYVDHEMDNGRQPDANLGVAAGLATKILIDVEKLFDESCEPEIEGQFVEGEEDAGDALNYMMGGLEVAAKARAEDLKQSESAFATAMENFIQAGTNLGTIVHVGRDFRHPFAERNLCRLCDA